MLPVRGPFTKTVSLPSGHSSLPALVSTASFYKQKRPYKGYPLPYKLLKTFVTDFSLSETTPSGFYPVLNYLPGDESSAAIAYNKAYSKLQANLGDQSLWAVNLHEYRQSADMITRRASQLSRFVNRLNHFDVPGAWKALGAGIPSSGAVRRSQKGLANAFLEVHFGWVPLVQDIEGAVKTLTSDPPFRQIVGKGSSSFDENHQSSTALEFSSTSRHVSCKALISEFVRVSNPNLFLASQLGLVNPAGFVWETVPYSFVLDWFVNVGQVLNSYTDHFGLEITNSFRTSFQVDSFSFQGNFLLPADPRWYSLTYGLRGIAVERLTGPVPGPSLRITPFRGFSVVRGATAVSLLIQRLGR